jgi:DNA topoisomerase VI subunit B
VVDSTVYNSIDLCSNYKIIGSEPVRMETVGKSYKNIVLDDNGTYSTIKNNMIFVVDSAYAGEIDRWSYECR